MLEGRPEMGGGEARETAATPTLPPPRLLLGVMSNGQQKCPSIKNAIEFELFSFRFLTVSGLVKIDGTTH